MSGTLPLVIENGIYVLMFLICGVAGYMNFKQSKAIAGADILALGFILYALYGLLAWAGPGFTGSYFASFAKVGKLETQTLLYFISFPMRLGLILIVIGLYRIGHRLKA